MRRKERELTDTAGILDILERCHTLRLGFCGEEYPYVVPVSFGVRREGEQFLLYFHGAKEGTKMERLEREPRVCVEGDIFYRTEETPYGITTRYESVIGYGKAEKVQGEEAVDGLRAICEHYQWHDYPVEGCKNLAMTAVYKIKVEKMTGKRNLPEK